MNLTGLPPNSLEISPDLADFNGDGQVDVLVGTAAGTISVHPMGTTTTALSNRSLVSSANNDRVTHLFSVTAQIGKKWQNPQNQLDVDADGNVSPLDVLILINYLNSRSGTLTDFQKPFLDVSGDDDISPLDALLVINYLNSGLRDGEGESSSFVASPRNPIESFIGKPTGTTAEAYSVFEDPTSLESLKRKRLKNANALSCPSEAEEWESLLDGIAKDIVETGRS